MEGNPLQKLPEEEEKNQVGFFIILIQSSIIKQK